MLIGFNGATVSVLAAISASSLCGTWAQPSGCDHAASRCGTRLDSVLFSTPSCSSGSSCNDDERRCGCSAMRSFDIDLCGRSSVNAIDCSYFGCSYTGSSDARRNHSVPAAACSPRARNSDAATTCTTLACGSVAYAS